MGPAVRVLAPLGALLVEGWPGLVGALLNVSGELSGAIAHERFKSVITGDLLDARSAYQRNVVQFRCVAQPGPRPTHAECARCARPRMRDDPVCRRGNAAQRRNCSGGSSFDYNTSEKAAVSMDVVGFAMIGAGTAVLALGAGDLAAARRPRVAWSPSGLTVRF